jgi:glycolate oxidase
MSQWISGVEAVLGDGSVVRTGSWSVRGMMPFARAPMPDLTGLFTSFQGTTGIVTQLAFQLWPKHPLERRLFILGYTAEGVFGAVQKLCRQEICEDIGGLSWPSGKMMLGVQRPNPIPDPDEPKWFLYVDLAAELDEEMAFKERLVRSVLAEQRAAGHRFEEPLDVNTLVKVNPAMSAFAEFPTELTVLTDHGGGGLSWMGTYGPLSRFAATSDRCTEIMVEHGFAPGIVSRPMRGGHFGVLRFLVTFDKSNTDEVERVRKVMLALLEAVTDAGFAMYKTPAWALEWLADRIDPRSIELVRAIKKLTDPAGIFNPGKWDL